MQSSFTPRALGSYFPVSVPECSFLPLPPHLSVLANTYFTQETLGFSRFLLNAAMSRKTLEAVINSQHMATGFTAVTTPSPRFRPFCCFSVLVEHIYISFPFIKAIQDLFPPGSWESTLRARNICLLLKCTCHFWQFGSELLSDSHPRMTLSFASPKPGQLL